MWKRLKDKEAELITANLKLGAVENKLREANQHVTDMHYWIAKSIEVKFSVKDAIGPLHIAIQSDPIIFAENREDELDYAIETQALKPTLVHSGVVIPKLQALGMTRARLTKMITSSLLSEISLFLAKEWSAKVMERIYGDDSTGAA